MKTFLVIVTATLTFALAAAPAAEAAGFHGGGRGFGGVHGGGAASAASMRDGASEADTVISVGIAAATGTTATAAIMAVVTAITARAITAPAITHPTRAPWRPVRLSASLGLPLPARRRVTEVEDKRIRARRRGATGTTSSTPQP